MTSTFKIVFKKDSQTEPEIRRVTIKEAVNLETLRKQATKLFQIGDGVNWNFRWQDEEGDFIKLTEEYEFEDVLKSKHIEPVIRLYIHVEVPVVPSRVPQDCPKVFGAKCDLTHVPLSIDKGNWFHLSGSFTDLCGEEFNKLPEEEQQGFVKVTQPSDLLNQQHFYETDNSGRLEKKKHKQIKKNEKQERKEQRQHHKTEKKADAEGKAKRKCSGDAEPKEKKQHKTRNILLPDPDKIWKDTREMIYVARCNVTGRLLKVGKGWFHKQGSTLDLCEEAFNKLHESEQINFVRVQSPSDLGEEKLQYNAVQQAGGAIEQLFLGIFERVASVAATSSEALASLAASSPIKTSQIASSSSSSSFSGVVPTQQVNSVNVITHPSAELKTHSGAHVLSVWEIENTGTATWNAAVLKPKAGHENAFQFAADYFAVPVLAPGQRGSVAVSFTTLEVQTEQLVETVIEFVDSDGNIFGQPLHLRVRVEPKQTEVEDTATAATQTSTTPLTNEAELVKLLSDMGFSDVQLCTLVLRQNSGDVNAAALALLRSQQQ